MAIAVPYFKTPKELVEWMCTKLIRVDTPKLAPNDFNSIPTLETNHISGLEACMLEYNILTKLGYNCSMLYVRDTGNKCRHIAVIYFTPDDNRWNWFEWDWIRYAGIHSYASKDKLIDKVTTLVRDEVCDEVITSEGVVIPGASTYSGTYYKDMSERWKKVRRPECLSLLSLLS